MKPVPVDSVLGRRRRPDGDLNPSVLKRGLHKGAGAQRSCRAPAGLGGGRHLTLSGPMAGHLDKSSRTMWPGAARDRSTLIVVLPLAV
jgi:hypothetical protein